MSRLLEWIKSIMKKVKKPTVAELSAEYQQAAVALVERMRAITRLNKETQALSTRLNELVEQINKAKANEDSSPKEK